MSTPNPIQCWCRHSAGRDHEGQGHYFGTYISIWDDPPTHTCRYTVPVFKLGHLGGRVPLLFKCEVCGGWEGEGESDD